MSKKLPNGAKSSPKRLVGSRSALLSAISLLAVSLGATDEAAAKVKKAKVDPKSLQSLAPGVHISKAKLIARKAGKGQSEAGKLSSDQQKTNLIARKAGKGPLEAGKLSSDQQKTNLIARKAGKGPLEAGKLRLDQQKTNLTVQQQKTQLLRPQGSSLGTGPAGQNLLRNDGSVGGTQTKPGWNVMQNKKVY